MIFQNQISSIDSEINQLLAQVEAARQKQSQLTELDALTDNSLTQLKTVVSKVGHYDKSAIANLKSAVLTLFDPGDHGDSGGNQPIDPTPDDDPAPGDDPTPSDDEPSFIDEDSLEYPTFEGQSCDIGHDLDWYWERCAKPEGQAWEFASLLEFDKPLVAGSRFWFGGKENTGTVIQQLGDVEYEVQIDGALGTVKLDRHQLHYIPTCLEGQSCHIDQAPKTGQKCSWATPFASPLCSVLWENSPLNGQYCTITPSATEDNGYKSTSEGERMPYVQFVEVTDKVGYLKVTHSGEIKAAYAGFTRKDRAEAWGRLLAVTYDIASGFEVRPAKHLPFKWELKLWGMSVSQIQKLAAEDLTKSPRVEVNSAKPPHREPVISPAQAAGIEPPSGWRQVQPQEQPITPGALVRHCVDAKFNIFQYGILQETSSSEAEVWFEQDGVSKKVDLATIELIATDPQYAKVLDSKSEWLGQTFVIVQTSKAGLGCSLLTPKGVIWFRADGVQILDAEVEEIAQGSSPEQSEPEQAELPIYQRSDGGFEVEQIIKENASILQVGDVVEIVGSRHPQHFGLVGTVESLNHFSELPLSVRTPRGLKGYLRSDLKFISKGDNPQSQGLQSGQVLMGSRIITSGNYIGLRRSAATFKTAERIATIQLAKDLENLGFDPQLATSVMAGEDDASDF